MNKEDFSSSALNKQQGGDHYKRLPLQPIEFVVTNNIGFIEGNVIKYVCRHRFKNGIEDIDKAIHYLEILKELVYKKDNKNGKKKENN